MPALALVAVLLFAAACGDGGSDSTPSPSPSPSPRPLTATGTIGYITPQGDFALMDANGSNQRAITQDGGVTAFSWSPDGTAAASNSGIGSDGSWWSSSLTVREFEARWVGSALVPTGDRLALNQGRDRDRRIAMETRLREWRPAKPGRRTARLAFIKLGADGTGVPVIGDIAIGTETPLAACSMNQRFRTTR
jgi:hypothetical protein